MSEQFIEAEMYGASWGWIKVLGCAKCTTPQHEPEVVAAMQKFQPIQFPQLGANVSTEA